MLKILKTEQENQGFPNGGGVVAGCNPQNKRNGDQKI